MWAYQEYKQARYALTDHSILSFDPATGRLQISRRYNTRDEQPRLGPTVTLDAMDLAAHADALALLRAFVRSAAAGTAAARGDDQPSPVPVPMPHDDVAAISH
jgi:hypothetical protein